MGSQSKNALMHKDRDITDFFKPYSRNSKKRSLYLDDQAEEPRTIRRSLALNGEPTTPAPTSSPFTGSSGLSTLTQEPSDPGPWLSSTLSPSLPTRSRSISNASPIASRINFRQPEASSTLQEEIEQAANPRTFSRPAHETPSKSVAPGPEEDASESSNKLDHTLQSSSEFRSTQSAFLTNSHRILKNGKVMVTNSDDEGSDSDGSLVDVEVLLRRPKPPSLVPEREDSPSAQKTGRANKRTTRSSANKNASNGQLLESKSPSYKYTLDSLVQSSRDRELYKASIATATSILGGAHKTHEFESRDNDLNASGTKAEDQLVLSVMQQGNDQDQDLDRLLTAIHRTEALQQESCWSFFRRRVEESSYSQCEMPTESIQILNRSLHDSVARQQSCLSGYHSDVANGLLPDELLIYLMDAVCMEPRDDLRYSHIRMLKRSGKEAAGLLTPDRIDALLRRLGANDQALHIKEPVNSDRKAIPERDKVNYDRLNLYSFLDLLESVADQLSTTSRVHAICLASRMLLDVSIVNDVHAAIRIDDVIASLVDNISPDDTEPECDAILNTIYPFVKDSALRLQLLQNFPTTSPTLSLLRRRLALAYFFDDPSCLTRAPQDLVNFSAIERHLQTPRYALDGDTDYAEVAHLITVLSIAFDCGDPRLPFANREEERAFIKDVDLLTEKIKAMCSKIVDTGTSGMRRTHAKGALEAFQYTLEYAVRTRPKPKMKIFNGAELGRDQTTLTKSFLTSRKAPQFGLDMQECI